MSATVALAAFLAALLSSGASAQTAATETVWASVAYVFYGETTPDQIGSRALTPLGSQQLYAQGGAFRARYLTANVSLSQEQNLITTKAPIWGIEDNAIDNNMLKIVTNQDPWVTASALAFTQALYPPSNQTYTESSGGVSMAILSDGSYADYPLKGYQYPNIESLSILDPNAIWIEGNSMCSNLQKSLLTVNDDPAVNEDEGLSLAMYQWLFNTTFPGVFPPGKLNFDFADELYTYAAYMYAHNATVRAVLNTTTYMDKLQDYASQLAWAKFGNLTASGSKSGDMIRAVAGRTVADGISSYLDSWVRDKQDGAKLTLMFGSYEPLVSFFALADMNRPAFGSVFSTLPNFGASMMFEVFSPAPNATAGAPTAPPTDPDDLWVRFLYRNGSDPSAPFAEYPLFGRPLAQSRMRYPDFQAAMSVIGVGGLTGWCYTCDASTLFCDAILGNSVGGGGRTTGGSSGSSGSHSSQGPVSPAVAGVIGAIVALGLIALAVILAAVFGRLRIYRRPAAGEEHAGKAAATGGAQPPRRPSFLGGFKGAEKMASDTDLAFSKQGRGHERTGSWELRGGNAGAGVTVASGDNSNSRAAESAAHDAGVRSKDFASSSSRPVVDDDDDTIALFGAKPVRPREDV